MDRTSDAYSSLSTSLPNTALPPGALPIVVCRFPDEILSNVVSVDSRSCHDLRMLFIRVSRRFRAIAIREGAYSKLYISGERRRLHKSKIPREPKPSMVSKVLCFPRRQEQLAMKGLTFAAIARELTHPWPEMEAESDYTEEQIMEVDRAVLRLFLDILRGSEALRTSVREIVFRPSGERPKRFNVSPNILREILTLGLPNLESVHLAGVCIMEESMDYDGDSIKLVLKTLHISGLLALRETDSTFLARLLLPFHEIENIVIIDKQLAYYDHAVIHRGNRLNVLRVALPNCTDATRILEFVRPTVNTPALQELAMCYDYMEDFQRLTADYTNLRTLKLELGDLLLSGWNHTASPTFPSRTPLFEGPNIARFRNLVDLTVGAKYCLGDPRNQLHAVLEMLTQVADTEIQCIRVDLQAYGDIWGVPSSKWGRYWAQSLGMVAALDWARLDESLSSRFKCLKRLRMVLTFVKYTHYTLSYTPEDVQELIQGKLVSSRAQELTVVSTIVQSEPKYVYSIGYLRV